MPLSFEIALRVDDNTTMHIYIIGINGAGMSALAHVALDAGYKVSGSDLEHGINTQQLKARDAKIHLGDTTHNIQQTNENDPIDTVVVSSAIPPTSSELEYAREHNITIQKRGPFINFLLKELDLKLVAIAGTHGKTTTSAMLVWLMEKLKQPASHIVGTNLSFANAGTYKPGSEYMILEADEYDKLMLEFEPYITAIVSLDYDHPDIYQTKQEYIEAFEQLIIQSENTVAWHNDAAQFALNQEDYLVLPDDQDFDTVKLSGLHNRRNAWLAATTAGLMLYNNKFDDDVWSNFLSILSDFPGSGRRFEQIAPHTYSDYGHSPAEIAATLQLAQEVAKPNQNIIAVYQPHQNVRQHLVRNDYKNAFKYADAIYWLPTYLSREDPQLEVLRPEELIEELSDKDKAAPTRMDDELIETIKKHQANNDMVILFGAGSIDAWARENLL